MNEILTKFLNRFLYSKIIISVILISIVITTFCNPNEFAPIMHDLKLLIFRQDKYIDFSVFFLINSILFGVSLLILMAQIHNMCNNDYITSEFNNAIICIPDFLNFAILALLSIVILDMDYSNPKDYLCSMIDNHISPYQLIFVAIFVIALILKCIEDKRNNL